MTGVFLLLTFQLTVWNSVNSYLNLCKKYMKKILLLLISVLILNSSCKKIITSENNRVARINIADAEFLASVNHDLSDESHPVKIVKKSTGYSSEAIKFLNTEGDIIDDKFVSYDVWWIFNVSPDYICMFGEFNMAINEDSNNMETYTSILVRKSDGAIFNFNGHYLEGGSYYMGQTYPQKDIFDAIYYSSDFEVYKLNVSDPGKLTQKKYLPDNQRTDKFFIDGDGNCFYNGTDSYFTKIKKATGGIIVNNALVLTNLWKGFNQKTYWLFTDTIESSPANTQCSVSEVNIVGDQVSATMIANHSLNISYLYFSHLLFDTTGFATQLLFEDSREGIIGEIYREAISEIAPLFLPEELSYNKRYKVISYSGNYVYIVRLDSGIYSINYSGKEIIRIDTREYATATRSIYGVSTEGLSYTSFKSFSIPAGYEIYGLLPSGETIIFSGLRYSDEKNVIMIIDQDGNLNLVEETGNDKYSELQRLK